MTRDLTRGKPIRLIVSFFIPILLGALFQQMYNITDTAIVGKTIGKEALAAVGSVGSLTFLVFGFALGMCGGFCLPVARYFGAKDERGVRMCTVNILYLCAGLGVVLSVSMVLLSGPVLRLMNTPEDMFAHAHAYLRVMFAGIGVTVFYNILAGLSRALGDSRTPLYFLILASVLNVGLDLLLILAFRMGTAGAGLATVLAQLVSGLCCLVYMRRRFPTLRLKRTELAPDRRMMGHLLYMGIPMALQFSITALGSIVLQSQVNPWGSDLVAAITSAGKVQMILCQPLEAIGVTLATYAGQNLGAGRLDRVRSGVRAGTVLAAGLSLVCFGLAATVGPELTRLLFLTRENWHLLPDIRQYLLVIGAFLFPLGLLLVLRSAVQGLGYAMPAMAAGAFELAARIVVGVFFVRELGFDGVLLANPAAWVAADLFLMPLYFTVIGRLKKRMGAKATPESLPPPCDSGEAPAAAAAPCAAIESCGATGTSE